MTRCEVCLPKGANEEEKNTETQKKANEGGVEEIEGSMGSGTPDLRKFLDAKEETDSKEGKGSKEFTEVAEGVIRGIREEMVASDEEIPAGKTGYFFDETTFLKAPSPITGLLVFRPKTPNLGRSLTGQRIPMSPIYEGLDGCEDEGQQRSPGLKVPEEPLTELLYSSEPVKVGVGKNQVSLADEPSDLGVYPETLDENEVVGITEDVPITPRTPTHPRAPPATPTKPGSPHPPETPASIALAHLTCSPSTPEAPFIPDTPAKMNPRKSRIPLAEELSELGVDPENLSGDEADGNDSEEDETLRSLKDWNDDDDTALAEAWFLEAQDPPINEPDAINPTQSIDKLQACDEDGALDDARD